MTRRYAFARAFSTYRSERRDGEPRRVAIETARLTYLGLRIHGIRP